MVIAGRRIKLAVAGCGHDLALTKDGDIFSRGSNDAGRLGTGTNLRGRAEQRGKYAGQSVPKANMRGVPGEHMQLIRQHRFQGGVVCGLEAGNETSCAVTTNGQLFTWSKGLELGHCTNQDNTWPCPTHVLALEGEFVVAVSITEWHTLAVTREDSVLGWRYVKKTVFNRCLNTINGLYRYPETSPTWYQMGARDRQSDTGASDSNNHNHYASGSSSTRSSSQARLSDESSTDD